MKKEKYNVAVVGATGLVGETMHKVDEKSAVADLKSLARVYETVLDRYFSP